MTNRESIRPEQDRADRKEVPIWRRVGAAAALAGVLGAGVGLSSCARDGSASNKQTSTTAPTAEGSASAESCPAEFLQASPDRGDQGRFVEQGVQSSEEMISLIGHDAASLAGAAAALGLGIHNTEDLVDEDENCLSTAGQALYNQAMGVMTANGTIVNDSDTAPSNAFNSGVQNGNVVVAEQPGITGELSATSYTWKGPNGETYTAYFLHRCANWVLPSQPEGIPVGQTDESQFSATENPGNPGYNPKGGAQVDGGEGSYSSGVTNGSAAEGSAPSGATTVDGGSSYHAPAADPGTVAGSQSGTQSGGAAAGTGSSGVTNPGESTHVDQGGGSESSSGPITGDVDPDQ